MTTFASYKVNNKPDSAGKELAHDHPQEKRPKSHVEPQSAVPQNDGFEEPPQKYGKPELDHRPTTSHSISNGMERPPEELSAHDGEEHHKHSPQAHKRQPHATGALRIKEHITEPAEGKLRPADEEPLTEVRAAVPIPDDDNGNI